MPGLGDELGFVVVDRGTLQATVAANVFALGDATDVPTSKAGSVAHFQGETLVSNIGRFLEGRELEPSFDGHTNCFIETGFHKALLIDFNYETEPLRGRFPDPTSGRSGCSRSPGRPMPGISSKMPAGKKLDATSMKRSMR